MKIESKVLNLIKKPILDIGMRVDNIVYIKEENLFFLRIFIDKDPYVEIDDCVKATKIINKYLDEEDIIKESYILDVCSKEKGGK